MVLLLDKTFAVIGAALIAIGIEKATGLDFPLLFYVGIGFLVPTLIRSRNDYE